MKHYKLLFIYSLFNFHYLVNNPLIFLSYCSMIFTNIFITANDNHFLGDILILIDTVISLLYIYHSNIVFLLLSASYIYIVNKFLPHNVLGIVVFNDLLFNYIKLFYDATLIGRLLFYSSHHVISLFMINLLNTKIMMAKKNKNYIHVYTYGLIILSLFLFCCVLQRGLF